MRCGHAKKKTEAKVPPSSLFSPQKKISPLALHSQIARPADNFHSIAKYGKSMLLFRGEAVACAWTFGTIMSDFPVIQLVVLLTCIAVATLAPPHLPRSLLVVAIYNVHLHRP